MQEISSRRLADIDREISHALQVRINPERRNDGAQIDGNGLMQRDERKTSMVDVHVQLVDAGIAGNDLGDQLLVSIDDGLHGDAQALFGQCPHRQ